MKQYLLVLVISLGFAGGVRAQTFGRVEDTRTTLGTYFVHVRPGESTLQLTVWGTVRLPGVYEVSSTTTLDQLLAFAGGPPETPRQSGSRREITVRLYRGDTKARSIVYESSVERMMLEPERYPALQDGDILAVETIEHKRFDWRDGMTIGTGVAAILLAVERAVSLLQ